MGNSLPLSRWLEAAHNNLLPVGTPSSVLLIKGASSQKTGGRLLRKMHQQAQVKKEEDPGGSQTSFKSRSIEVCYQGAVSMHSLSKKGAGGVNKG